MLFHNQDDALDMVLGIHEGGQVTWQVMARPLRLTAAKVISSAPSRLPYCS